MCALRLASCKPDVGRFILVIPILALIMSFALLASATAWNLIAGAIALVVGAVLYLLKRPVAE